MKITIFIYFGEMFVTQISNLSPAYVISNICQQNRWGLKVKYRIQTLEYVSVEACSKSAYR